MVPGTVQEFNVTPYGTFPILGRLDVIGVLGVVSGGLVEPVQIPKAGWHPVPIEYQLRK